jgi:hypothetical protein
MATYLISPPEETSWRMARQDLGRLLTRLWPDALLYTPAEPMRVRAVAWESKDGPHGSLDEAGQCLYIEIGDYADIARLAFHVKQELAPDQDLLLYRESLDEIIHLEEQSEQDILHSLTGDAQ